MDRERLFRPEKLRPDTEMLSEARKFVQLYSHTPVP